MTFKQPLAADSSLNNTWTTEHQWRVPFEEPARDNGRWSRTSGEQTRFSNLPEKVRNVVALFHDLKYPSHPLGPADPECYVSPSLGGGEIGRHEGRVGVAVAEREGEGGEGKKGGTSQTTGRTRSLQGEI